MSLSNLFLLAATTFTILISCTPSSTSASPLLSSLSATSPWASFMNLSGCQIGDHNSVLPVLKKYLHHYGYLADSANLTNDSFDDILESALETYQQNFGLEATGVLDLRTIEQLITPRCGMPDIINGATSMAAGKLHGRNLFTFFPGEPMWPPFKRNLAYALTSTSTVSIDRSVLSKVFARAFARWSATTLLNFTEVASEAEADITIGFYRGDHGDGEPFDGVLGTLAHAFSPTDGRFHLDAAEFWVAGEDVTKARSANAVDLESVAVHEIGHLLGLGHSSETEAIMFPTIKAGTRRVELASDDVNGVQSLYGSNPTYQKTASGPAPAGAGKDTSGGVGLELGWGGAVGLFLAVVAVRF